MRLVPSRYYAVATNDFLAAGGDGYTVFAGTEHLGEYPGLDEVLIEYRAQVVVAPEVVGWMRVFKAWGKRPACG